MVAGRAYSAGSAVGRRLKLVTCRDRVDGVRSDVGRCPELWLGSMGPVRCRNAVCWTGSLALNVGRKLSGGWGSWALFGTGSLGSWQATWALSEVLLTAVIVTFGVVGIVFVVVATCSGTSQPSPSTSLCRCPNPRTVRLYYSKVFIFMPCHA